MGQLPLEKLPKRRVNAPLCSEVSGAEGQEEDKDKAALQCPWGTVGKQAQSWPVGVFQAVWVIEVVPDCLVPGPV